MSVHSTVLEAPHEAHDVRQNVELIDHDKSKGRGRQDDDDTYIDKCCEPARLAVDEIPNKEAAKNLSEAKEDHCEHRPFELILIIPVDRVLKHLNQVTRKVCDRNSGPDSLRKDPHETSIEKKF